MDDEFNQNELSAEDLAILQAFDEMDLWRDTVIVFSADHGEMGGAHGGIKGKGPFAYEQNAHVPPLIAHPANNTAHPAATAAALDSFPNCFM